MTVQRVNDGYQIALSCVVIGTPTRITTQVHSKLVNAIRALETKCYHLRQLGMM